MDALLKILICCDICAIQEVRDSKGEAVPSLVQELNRRDTSHHYAYLESKRLGRNSYKEQYVFIYRSDMVKLTDWCSPNALCHFLGKHTYTHTLYKSEEARSSHLNSLTEILSLRQGSRRCKPIPRTSSPAGERESRNNVFFLYMGGHMNVSVYGVDLSFAAIKDFVLVCQHTSPKEAAKEINRLFQVIQEVKERWTTENIMLLGDLNAGCGYMTSDDWKRIHLRSSNHFHWLIDDKDDTTVSPKTHCPYDRSGSLHKSRGPGLGKQLKRIWIVIHGDEFFQAVVLGSARPFDFRRKLGLSEEEALAISDHYPVEVDLQLESRRNHEL
ncbi:deoxyribonuclease-1-like [Rhinatrema bivittatum]|uniref:deoxyribonuclease-1-like n=1 Tax=Rhinatrema bivittatum TaxID=194408 RepID=UPI00112EC7D1|nr:deoxyribonuclease-1-like [Rhinatrema bivittatum]